MKKVLNIIIVAVIALMTSSCGYNSMVEKQESVVKTWANVETQYQRRADLIPNLVNTVKGYAEHEKSTLTAVVEARAKATSVNIDPSNMTSADMQNFNAAQGGLGSALSKLMVVVEKYPDLKANESFMQLQAQLEGTENRISVARKNYNDVVGDYNTYIKKFPKNFIVGWFDFESKPYFESKEGSDVAPVVAF
ncbi:MAG: LemA protein [Halieaceae bacterium]|jgi:LemA protein